VCEVQGVKITAALSWWDELPEDLDACVTGVASVADRIVAVDGAYRRYPGAKARSDDSQVAAIRDAAAASGIECLIIQSDRTWTGEIEKRSTMMAIAAIATDWVIVIDADHVISAIRKEVRAELAQATADTIEAPFVTPLRKGRTLAESSATNWHARQNAGKEWLPLIFRALPGLTVERRHWWYSAYKNGTKVWLGGGDGSLSEARHARITTRYSVEHRCLYRSPERIRIQRAWYNDRVIVVEKTGQEDSQPGLPESVYDYETVPY
jgi:hypothetical protein